MRIGREAFTFDSLRGEIPSRTAKRSGGWEKRSREGKKSETQGEVVLMRSQTGSEKGGDCTRTLGGQGKKKE